MKKSSFLILIFLLIGVFLGINTVSKNKIPFIGNESKSYSTSIPKKLLIPNLGINAPVELVGQDSQGRMDVPKNFQDVGWYELGAKPGDKGNAVVAGHLDTITGAPGIFAKISSLKQGDEISIIDSNNNLYKFMVKDIKTYDDNSFPLEQVFGKNDKRMLNLITCSGFFNTYTKNYSQRIVVYSELSNNSVSSIF